MEAILQAENREFKGRKSRNLLLEQGKIPAVIYGRDIESIAVSVNNKELKKILQKFGNSQLIELVVGENKYNVVIKEMQHNPINQQLIHLDFHRVALDELTKAMVPVVLVGEPQGAKDGCILQQHIREVEVECLPTDIPENIEYNVEEMKVDDDVLVGDLQLVDGVEIISEEKDAVVATLFFSEIDEADLEVAEEKEPELIVEEKEEEVE